MHGNRKCKMVRNDETDQRKKNRLYVEKENRLCCFFFFFVTSNQFIIICLASDFHSLCRCFSTFCKLIPIGWMRIQQMFSVFIANAFYMSGLWLASGYALGVIVYAVEFVFFFFLQVFESLDEIESVKLVVFNVIQPKRRSKTKANIDFQFFFFFYRKFNSFDLLSRINRS